VPEVVGDQRSLVVAMDWTDFDADGQATLALNLVTGHGRATPLLWLTMLKDELTGRRNDIEDACLARLSEVLPAAARVTILADRGFGDHTLFAFLTRLGFDYVIRFRANIHVTAADGERRRRPRAQAARRRPDRPGRAGRRCRLRAGQGHEGPMVPGGQ
jgi:hypothetical protein